MIHRPCRGTPALFFLITGYLILPGAACKRSGDRGRRTARTGERIALAGVSVVVPKGWTPLTEQHVARLRAAGRRGCAACKVNVVGRKGKDGIAYIAKTVYPRTVTLNLLKVGGGRVTVGALLEAFTQGQNDRARLKGATFIGKPRIEKRERAVFYQTALQLVGSRAGYGLHMRGSYRLGCDGRLVSLGVICTARRGCNKLLALVREPARLRDELRLTARLPKALMECLNQKK